MKQSAFSLDPSKPWKKKSLTACILVCMVVWQFFFVGKGIDGSDTGYYLANYKWAFEQEGIISSSAAFSTLAGALIYQLLPGAHLLMFRILNALAYILISFCGMYLLGKERSHLCLLSLLGGMFYLRKSPMTLSYNTFSFLLFALALCALMLGLRKGCMSCFAAAGVIIGVNVLFRLPNVLQTSMVLAIPLYGWKAGWTGKAIGKAFALYCIGFLAGLAASLAVLCAVIGKDAVLSGYGAAAELGNDSESSHGIINMIFGMLRQFVLSCAVMSGLWLGAGVLAVCEKVLKKNKGLGKWLTDSRCKALAILGGTVYGALIAVLLPASQLSKVFMTAGILTALATVFFWKTLDGEKLALAWLLLIGIMSIASGTDNGFGQYIMFGAPILAMTVQLLEVLREQTEWSVWKKLPAIFSGKTFGTAMMSLLLTTALISSGILLHGEAYRDARYTELTEMVAAPELAGMQTTEERAALLDALYTDLQNPALVGYPLATVGHVSIAYVISNQDVFFESVWPDLDSYPTAQYKACLQQQEAAGVRPIIAMLALDEEGFFTSDSAEEKYGMLMEFAQRHDYVCIRDDEAYRLYVPLECIK